MEELSRVIGWIEALSPRIWAVYVHQQYVKGIVDLVWAIFLAISLYPLYKAVAWARKKQIHCDYDDDEMMYGFLCIVASCALLASAIVIPITLTGAAYSLFTPEYCAIQDLLSTIK